MRSASRCFTSFSCVIGWVAGILAWGAVSGLASAADETAKLKLSRTIVLNEVGDAKIKVELKLPVETYTTAKSSNPNTAVILRRLGITSGWARVDNAKARFDDNASSLVAEYDQVGLARLTSDDAWEVLLDAESKADQLHAADNAVLCTAARQTDWGLATVTLRLEAPKAGKDVQLQHNPERITYRFAPTAPQGTSPAAVFSVDTKTNIMAALGKAYSDSRLTELWVARSVLKNTGDQTISDYRVRFRLAGYSDWSEWKKARRVLPGQTMVDAYFPVFEIEKIAQLSGARPIMLHVEYEYRQPDGRMVREGDSRQLQMLGRNQAVFSSFTDEEAVGFYDQYNNGPMLLAALVTGDDPVIQELAGRISRAAGGVAASQKDEDALKFLSTLYTFYTNNSIAYQTPPSSKVSGQYWQSVKYGRDVLRNRAGTCVDMAVLYASVCESVGLKPVLYLMAGHCLPGVKLPGGDLVQIEMTGSSSDSFTAARDAGAKRVKEARAKNELFEIDVAKWRSAGLQALDLPPMETAFLEATYRYVGGTYQAATTTQPAASTSSGGGDAKKNLPNIVGRWTLDQAGNGNNIRLTLVLGIDGKYTYTATSLNAVAAAPTSESGTYQQEETWLKFLPEGNKAAHTYFYKLRGDDLELLMQGTSTPAIFHRAK